MWPFPHLAKGDSGKAVSTAQWLLHHNRYDRSFSASPIDGQFGDLTAAGSKNAKYLLGFKEVNVLPTFGPSLYSYLIPKGDAHAALRTPAMLVRAHLRARYQSPRQKALSLALTQVGTREYPPYSNLQKYGAWMGDNGVAWCAIFVSWCFSHVGRAMNEINTGVVHQKGINHQDGFGLVSTPVPGDLCCMNFGTPDEHIGIFHRVIDAGHFEMVSGNTGTTTFADGGEVLLGVFPYSQCDGFVRVS